MDIKIIDQVYCRKIYAKSSLNIYDTQICANEPITVKGSCQVSYLHKELQ